MKPESMEPKCPQCSAAAAHYLNAKDLNQKITDSVFYYYRCINCKLIFLDPIPTNLSDYYQGEYPPYSIPGSLEDLDLLERRSHWRVEFVKQYKDKGKMLEIGPSYGAFAYGAWKAGFQVDAIEMDEECCRFMNSMTEVNAINTKDVVGVMSSSNAKYDVIVLWHNLEHLADPWSVLRQCSTHLVPGGILIISSPNPDSAQFRIFKGYWVHLDAPRHLELIPRAVLTDFLRRRNMQMLSTTTTDPDGLKLNAMSWNMSTAHLFGISNDRNLFRRAVSRLLNLISSPLERLAEVGTAYTVVFRKNE